MRNAAIASLLVVAILVGAGAGYFIGVDSVSSSTSQTSVATTCTIPDEGEVMMQVLNSTNGDPIGSAQVQAQFLAPECQPNPHTITTLSPMTTNSSGYVTLGGEVGEYILGVVGSGYSVGVAVGPGQIACLTIGIPSGETHVTYTGFMATSLCHFGL